VLLAADGDQRLAAAYDTLLKVAQRTAGAEAHDAWESPPITTDAEMNMAAVFNRMGDLRTQLDIFRDDLARATLPRRTRLRCRLRPAGSNVQ
jgi:hypothetical protein